MIRNSPEHLHAIRLIDVKRNQQIDEAKKRFIDGSRRPDYDPDFDPAFKAVLKKIEEERQEEFRYLRMELDDPV